MAGLLAARMLTASGNDVHIFERQKELPDNHSGVLRFKTPAIGDILGIPFKKVSVVRELYTESTALAGAMTYAYLGGGVYRSDRNVPLVPERVERYVAPEDFVARMAAPIMDRITFGQELDLAKIAADNPTDGIISTIPMPALVAQLKYPRAGEMQFGAAPSLNVLADVSLTEAYCSVYVGSYTSRFYRVSMTGSKMIIECSCIGDLGEPSNLSKYDENTIDFIVNSACNLLGINRDRVHNIRQRFQVRAKIQPCDPEELRRDFIYWASTKGVRSLGRFATWRPAVLLDDLVQDIRKIEGWLKGDAYANSVSGRK